MTRHAAPLDSSVGPVAVATAGGGAGCVVVVGGGGGQWWWAVVVVVGSGGGGGGGSGGGGGGAAAAVMAAGLMAAAAAVVLAASAAVVVVAVGSFVHGGGGVTGTTDGWRRRRVMGRTPCDGTVCSPSDLTLKVSMLSISLPSSAAEATRASLSSGCAARAGRAPSKLEPPARPRPRSASARRRSTLLLAHVTTSDRRLSGAATGPRNAEAGSIAAAHAAKHANLIITAEDAFISSAEDVTLATRSVGTAGLGWGWELQP